MVNNDEVAVNNDNNYVTQEYFDTKFDTKFEKFEKKIEVLDNHIQDLHRTISIGFVCVVIFLGIVALLINYLTLFSSIGGGNSSLPFVIALILVVVMAFSCTLIDQSKP